jgi:UDP-3-O-[3-hydroxymyristoyl] glucosamine N-acyltransferase
VTTHRSTKLAIMLDGEHVGEETTWSGVATLGKATSNDLAFSEGQIPAGCRAGVVLVRTAQEGHCCIVVDDPKLAFIRVLERMFHVEHFPDCRAQAHIDPSAEVHPTASIHPGVVIMENCRVGADSVIFSNVVLYPETIVGDRVRIHAGAVLGSDGFGYHPTPDGLVKVPHLGCVVIEDDVEIGANSTIDRAFIGETRIGAGTKIDNLVHIGHNANIGSSVVIAAHTGLSGSVSVGSHTLIGGQVGIVEHTVVGSGSRIGAQSGVTRDVAAGTAVLGTPAEPAMKMKRIYAALRTHSDGKKPE